MNNQVEVIREYYIRRMAALAVLGVATPNDLERIGFLLDVIDHKEKDEKS